MKTIQFDVAVFSSSGSGFKTAEILQLPRVCAFVNEDEDVVAKAKEMAISHLSACTARKDKIEFCDTPLSDAKGQEYFRDAEWMKIEIDQRLMFHNSKRARRDSHPFNIGFFTPGTVCEIKVTGQNPQLMTVHHLVKNGPDSYVIVSDEDDEHIPGIKHSCNIGWVTKIVKHVPGRLVFDESRTTRRRKEFFEKENLYTIELRRKHPSQYCTMYGSHLIQQLVADYVKPDQLVDLDLLANTLRQQGALREVPTGREWISFVSVANKKKLRKTLQRVVTRCLVSPRAEQRREGEEMERMYAEDLVDDLDREYKTETEE